MPSDNPQNNYQNHIAKLDWVGLAEIINQLPEDENEKYLEMMLEFIHNLRQSISVVYAAEALLRRMVTNEKFENPIELLNAMQIAHQRIFNIVENMSNVFDAYEKKKLSSSRELLKNN